MVGSLLVRSQHALTLTAQELEVRRRANQDSFTLAARAGRGVLGWLNAASNGAAFGREGAASA